MKLIFNHSEGLFTESGCSLLEVECLKEDESIKYMFENGWLPFKDNKWYQSRSSRLKLSPISNRRKKELSKINFSTKGNYEEIILKAKPFGCFNEDWLKFYNSIPNYTFFMDDVAFGIVNYYDEQLFYTSFVWDKNQNKNSYGTLSYYHLIEKFRNEYEYIYISEFYEKFNYKQTLQGFQYWDGQFWHFNEKSRSGHSQ